MKKPTFEEVRLVHSRLSTVAFLPRGTLELSTADEPSTVKNIRNTTESQEIASGDVRCTKLQASALPALQLPLCGASTRLFTACLSGDAGRVSTLLSELRDSNGNNSNNLLSPVVLESWDLFEILNMPDSLESLATCLHIASESGSRSGVS